VVVGAELEDVVAVPSPVVVVVLDVEAAEVVASVVPAVGGGQAEMRRSNGMRVFTGGVYA
jgi:hypothetical protein